MPAGVRAHTDYFHQELIKTLAGGDAALLGNLILDEALVRGGRCWPA